MTPTNRRALLLMGAATIGGMGMGGTSTCSSTLDPAAIANAIKIACGIAVPAATVLEVINAAAGATAAMIISLVCSSYKNASAAQAGKLAAGGEVNFVVHVCDATGTACKDIPIVAKAQQ
jgi:hypothetical protein